MAAALLPGCGCLRAHVTYTLRICNRKAHLWPLLPLLQPPPSVSLKCPLNWIFSARRKKFKAPI